jgi:hypothetical protein
MVSGPLNVRLLLVWIGPETESEIFDSVRTNVRVPGLSVGAGLGVGAAVAVTPPVMVVCSPMLSAGGLALLSIGSDVVGAVGLGDGLGVRSTITTRGVGVALGAASPVLSEIASAVLTLAPVLAVGLMTWTVQPASNTASKVRRWAFI